MRDSMEDDLRTGTPYRISCLHQQPSGVDRRCQIWPIRGYTRSWYTGTASFEKIPQAFPLPQSPLVFPALSLALVFARAPLSERLEQAMGSNPARVKDFSLILVLICNFFLKGLWPGEIT